MDASNLLRRFQIRWIRVIGIPALMSIIFFVYPLLSRAGESRIDMDSVRLIFQLDIETTIIDLDWNFDSTLLAFADGNDSVSVVNVKTGEIDLRLDRAADEIYVIGTISWSSTQNYLLITSNLTKIWDYSQGEWLDSFKFPSGLEFVEYSQGSVDWHPDEDRFAIRLGWCDEGTPYRPGARVEIWDVTDSSFSQIAGCVGSLRPKWNPQGTQLAISRVTFDKEGFIESQEIEIWDVDTQEKLLTILDLKDPSGLAWSPAGDMIAFTIVMGINQFIQVRDANNGEIVSQVEANLGVDVSLDWHPSENLIATGGQDGSVRIWDALSGSELLELPVHEDTVKDVSWSPDGNMLASVGRDGKLLIWDVSGLE